MYQSSSAQPKELPVGETFDSEPDEEACRLLAEVAEGKELPFAGLDSEAFEALVSPHLAMFHHGIYRILGHHQDTQDALQEALLAIYRGLSKFEGRSQFSSWAYRVCINSALMHRRSRKRVQEDNLSDLQAPGAEEDHPDRLETLKGAATPPEAHDRVEREELRERMMRTMDLLPPAQREVFVLRDIEDWDTETVAKHLGVSSLVVRQRLHRARDFMLQRLRPQFLERA